MSFLVEVSWSIIHHIIDMMPAMLRLTCGTFLLVMQVLDKIKELNDDTSYNSILLLHPTVFTGPGSDEQKYLKVGRWAI